MPNTPDIVPILPLILCGGSGTRLWPLSRKARPKPLQVLDGEASLLQRTALRVAGRPSFLAPLVVCGAEHRAPVAEQLDAVGVAATAIVLEPVARDTAAAIVVGALLAAERGAMTLTLPSDHAIAPAEAFVDAVAAAVPAARAGYIVAFGVAPDRPAPGYGHIGRGPPLSGAVARVEAFVEKPDPERARAMAADGRHLWHSGILLFDPVAFLAEAERLEPETVAACRAALANARADPGFVRLDETAYARIAARSVDHAILERADRLAVAPLGAAWSDLGSWDALWEFAKQPGSASVAVGDVRAIDCDGCYLRADGVLLAAIGARDLVVVAERDAVLVVPRHEAGRVRELAAALAREGRDETRAPRRASWPWGWRETLVDDGGVHVARLMVKPGAAFVARGRAGDWHWTVAKGRARVTMGEDTRGLRANETIHLPAGASCRLANPGREPTHVIEVRVGAALDDEDDDTPSPVAGD